MPTTSPDGIYYADGSTPMSAEDISAAEATSVQDALDALVNDTRQIQSFLWANSAARSAQTGMVGGDFGYQTDTGVTYRYSGSAWVAFYPGALVSIIPTSVAGTGVSYSTTSGLVSFSASPAVSVNGCFPTAFTRFKIVGSFNRSTTLTVSMRLRLSGTDNTATNYDRQVLSAAAATVSTASTVNATSWDNFAGSGSGRVAMEATLFEPNTTDFTQILLDATSIGTSYIKVGAIHDVATAYDGVTITASTGNITGNLEVYGIA